MDAKAGLREGQPFATRTCAVISVGERHVSLRRSAPVGDRSSSEAGASLVPKLGPRLLGATFRLLFERSAALDPRQHKAEPDHIVQ